MVSLRRRKARQPAPHASDEALAQDIADVAAGVVELASARLGRPVDVAEGPEPVIGGHGWDVYRFRLVTEASDDPSWTGSLLVRATDRARLDREVRWTGAVAATGFPVSEIVAHAPEQELLVLRDPPGKGLIESMVADMASGPRLLASFGKLHAQLHGLPFEDVPHDDGDTGDTGDTGETGETGADDGGDPAAVREDGTGELAAPATVAALRERAASDTVVQALHDELAWLDNHPPTPGRSALCHGELHPGHVYLDPDEPSSTVVVNWSVARRAEPELDVGFTMAAFWFSPYYLDNPLYRKGMKMARDPIASAYLDAYREAATTPLDDDRLRWWQAFQTALMAVDLAHRIHEGPWSPWDPMATVVHPERTLTELRERFWELTRP